MLRFRRAIFFIPFSIEINLNDKNLDKILLVPSVSSPTEVTIQDAKKISVIKKVDITEYTVPSDVEKLNVTHKFLVRNEGPSNLLSTKVLVTVPFYLTDASRFVNSYDVQVRRVTFLQLLFLDLRVYIYIDCVEFPILPA